jgi:hypothetical protein
MFISFEYKEYLDKKDDKNALGYEIIDSEFGTASGVVNTQKKPSYTIDMAIAVIQEYSKRNLNVAANLAVAFVWLNKKYLDWSIQGIIDHNKKYNPFFSPYEEDLQKYLVLL